MGDASIMVDSVVGSRNISVNKKGVFESIGGLRRFQL